MSGREIMVGDKPLSSLRVVDLKAELEKRGLSKSGTKKDLVDRLKANLLLDKDRQEAAVSAAKIDEGELPNIAAKLPDDNPFVREYLQSQAELFHSQQVAKKLYREEQKRESEGSGASADERERSPLKSPSHIIGSISPVRHQPQERMVVPTTSEPEREKSPEKRPTRGRPPGSSKSKSPVRMEDGKQMEAPVIPKEVEALPPPPPKSPSKTVEPTSPLKHQTEESVELVTRRRTEREKSPEKRSTRSRQARSKSPVRVEEVKQDKAPVIPEEQEVSPPTTSPSKRTPADSPVKQHVEEKTKVIHAAEREKSPEQRSSIGRRAPLPEDTKQSEAPVIPEDQEVPPPATSPSKRIHISSVKQNAEENMEVIRAADREKSPEQRSSRSRRAPSPVHFKEVKQDKAPITRGEREVPSTSPLKIWSFSPAKQHAEDKMEVTPLSEREKSPEKRPIRGRPALSKSPVPMEETKEDKTPIIPEEAEAPPAPVSCSHKSKSSKVHEEGGKDATVDKPDHTPIAVKSPTKVLLLENHQVEEAVDATGTEKPKESSVLIQPVTSSPPPQSSTKHTKITLAEPEVPVEKSEKPIVKSRTKIIPIEFHDSDVGKVHVKEKQTEKGRSTTAELEKPRKEPPPAPTAKIITGKRSSNATEKENLLDEVLDYGEDESEDMAQFDEPSDVKRPQPASKLRPTEEAESPEAKVELIEFERRVMKINPNKHSQRRKEKFEEDRKERDKERLRPPLIVTSQLMKEWYPDLVMLTEEELKMIEENPPSTPPAEVERKLRITRTISNVESADGESLHGGGDGDSAVEEEEQTQQEMDLTIQRKISIISMDEEMTKGQTPPRRAPTQLILVTNLVRPFTVPQLRELLQRTGNVLDLWVDKIKSKCVAKYDTEDEAIETRTALHGVRWPLSNPKSLSVDFTTEERVDDLRKKDSGYVEEKPTASQHVREWDVGKKSPPRGQRKKSHSRDREDRDRDRDKKRSRRSSSGHGHARRRSRSPHSDRKDRNGDIKKAEANGKTLDELFRKTVVTPCIYWLPLNPQQIAEKEELRRKRMEERERRIAEMQQHPNRPQR